MDTLTITLPYLPPVSYNPNRNAFWAVKRGQVGQNRSITDDVRMLVLEAGWEGEPLQAARCWMTFHLPTRRRRDHDGLIAQSKPIWDSLVRAGVLIDDKLDVIGWPTYGHVYSKPEQTVIEIERTHTDRIYWN